MANLTATPTVGFDTAWPDHQIIAAQWMTFGAMSLLAIAAAAIVTIFFVGHPVAIGFGIAAIIVYALDCFTFWLFTHVSQEIFEFQPRKIINPDTASAIVFVAWIIRIVAALQHIRPAMIGWRLPAQVRMSVTSHDERSIDSIGVYHNGVKNG